MIRQCYAIIIGGLVVVPAIETYIGVHNHLDKGVDSLVQNLTSAVIGFLLGWTYQPIMLRALRLLHIRLNRLLKRDPR